MSKQKELDLSKPCVTEPGGVPCRLGLSSYGVEILIWNLLCKGYCNIKHYTDLHGNPLIFGFPRVVNAPEPDPLEQLDWEEIKHAVDTKLRAAYPGSIFFPPRTMIEVCYRVVAAKLKELKAKERTK